MAFQEFILYAQVPLNREDQVLKILAGLTRTQPVAVYEQALMYSPLKSTQAPSSKKSPARSAPQAQTQGNRPIHEKLVRDLDMGDDGSVTAKHWRLRIEQMPEAGTTVTSRPVQDNPATPSDIQRLNDPELSRFDKEFFWQGHRFVHKDKIIVRMVRMFSPKENHSAKDITSGAVPPTPASPETLKLVDISGSCVVEAMIRVTDGSNSNLAQEATQGLLDFATEMQGSEDDRVDGNQDDGNKGNGNEGDGTKVVNAIKAVKNQVDNEGQGNEGGGNGGGGNRGGGNEGEANDGDGIKVVHDIKVGEIHLGGINAITIDSVKLESIELGSTKIEGIPMAIRINGIKVDSIKIASHGV